MSFINKDYVEDEFAPVLTPSGSGSIALNTSFDTLAFIKNGRKCHVQGQLSVLSVISPVGADITLGVLPFPAATLTDGSDEVLCPIFTANTGAFANGFQFGIISGGGTTIVISAFDGTTLADKMQTAAVLFFNFSYITAA